MATNYGRPRSILGIEIQKRLGQLGISRRELSRRIPVSRQTLQELIHNPDKGFADSTFEALDIGLKWEAGTARAFHRGIINARQKVGAMSVEERINEYLLQILERLSQMDIEQLEREVILLEEESGVSDQDTETVRLVRTQVRKLVDSLTHNPNGGKPNRDAI
jgi:hypothetical protein